MQAFQQNGYSWLEPVKSFILTSNEAKNVASGTNLVEKAEFLKKVGSNLVLADQNLKYFPRGAWKILAHTNFSEEKLGGLGNLPHFSAEPRSGEAENEAENLKCSSMLGDFDSGLGN